MWFEEKCLKKSSYWLQFHCYAALVRVLSLTRERESVITREEIYTPQFQIIIIIIMFIFTIKIITSVFVSVSVSVSVLSLSMSSRLSYHVFSSFWSISERSHVSTTALHWSLMSPIELSWTAKKIEIQFYFFNFLYFSKGLISNFCISRFGVLETATDFPRVPIPPKWPVVRSPITPSVPLFNENDDPATPSVQMIPLKYKRPDIKEKIVTTPQHILFK